MKRDPSTRPASAPNGVLHRTIASDPAAIAGVRREVEQAATAAGLDEAAVCDLGLCVNEALANVIRHAYGGRHDRPIEIGCRCEDGVVEVTIRDWGNGVNPAELPPRPYDPLEPGGLGLICMQRMMDEARYVPQSDGMLLVMRAGRRAAGTPSQRPRPGDCGCGNTGRAAGGADGAGSGDEDEPDRSAR